MFLDSDVRKLVSEPIQQKRTIIELFYVPNLSVWLMLFMHELKHDAEFFFTMAQQPPFGQGLLIVEDSWSYSDTPQSVGLLWTSDQPDAETST